MSHDSWVSKVYVCDDFVSQFNGSQIDIADKMLAKFPFGCHPSSAGYEISKMMDWDGCKLLSYIKHMA